MEFKNDELGVSFTLPEPEKITVRMQMAYLSDAGFAYGKEYFERLWLGARTILSNWKCELIPDLQKLNLDAETNPKITDVIFWSGWEVKKYMDNLDKVPKN